MRISIYPRKSARCRVAVPSLVHCIAVTLHRHRENDPCIKVGRNAKHFNVSCSFEEQSHKTVLIIHNLCKTRIDRADVTHWSNRLSLLSSLKLKKAALDGCFSFLCYRCIGCAQLPQATAGLIADLVTDILMHLRWSQMWRLVASIAACSAAGKKGGSIAAYTQRL